jgi:RES domain-containing protein
MTPATHLSTALSGAGAALRGGRWNSKGVAAVYASIDAATTVLELLAAFDPGEAPEHGFRLLQLQLPDDVPVVEPALEALPAGWDLPEKTAETQAFGNAFLRGGQALVLIVPSATLPEARNAVINPAHERVREIKTLRTRGFSFDPRWPLRGR